MATLPTAQFWIRTDGADANGGGYDSGISGAATNYSDQAAAQATFTVLTLTVTTNVLTDTGGLGLFTALMIGNAVNVPGKGYYFITAFTNSNVVTVSLGTGAATSFTTQPGKVGGALRNLYALSNGGTVTAPGTTTPLVAGNQNNFRASGSGSVGSPDYPQTGYATYPAGNTTNGCISWVAYNGTPYIKGDGLVFYNPTFHKFYGLYVTAGSNNLPTYGIFGVAINCTLVVCTIDANNQSGLFGFGSAGAPTNVSLIGCTLLGGGTSSASAIYVGGGYGWSIKNCLIKGWGAWGIIEAGSVGTQIRSCVIAGNVSGGVKLITSATVVAVVEGCTIDANTGPNVYIDSTAAAAWTILVNNNITNGTADGILVNSGSATTNSAAIAFADYNNVHGNSSNYTNINAGIHDISVNPSYTSPSSNDYTPTNAALIAAATVPFA